MRWLLTILALLTLAAPAQAQYYQSDFPPNEFQARWAKLYDAIGDKAVALVQGAGSTRGFDFPRQNNDFYYLSGIETTNAYILLDGRTRKATLYLPPRDERLERAEGKVLSAADAETVKRLTGVDEVRGTDTMRGPWIEALLPHGTAIYLPHSPAEGYAQSRHELERADAAIASDYWDGRLPREQQLIGLVRARRPSAEIRDLTPILDGLRTIKSPREIALIRKASVLAGLGMIQSIRSTRSGAWEYELDAAARYVFLVNGSKLDAYRSIIASGTANINNMHYFRNNKRLERGELVLMDYAPDVGGYGSDIGRVWPVSGRYDPVQGQLLGTVLVYRDEILKRVRPGVTVAQILDETRAPMAAYIARQKWAKPIYEAAARRMVEKGDGAFTHMVGLAVHDVGSYEKAPLRPGLVIAIDPTLRVPEENLYLRYEDTVVVTDTGVENFTAFLPSRPEDLEALVGKKGIVQAYPAKRDW